MPRAGSAGPPWRALQVRHPAFRAVVQREPRHRPSLWLQVFEQVEFVIREIGQMFGRASSMTQRPSCFRTCE